MKVLFIGGIFEENHYEEIIEKTRGNVDYSANNFQKKIVSGLKKNEIDFQVISAPFIGTWPNSYKDIYFSGFSKRDTSNYRYVKFINIWGVRNIFRKIALKKEVQNFINDEDEEKYVIVYCAHTPFLQVANYIKKKDTNVKTCLVVPDLPQYMNLSDKVSILYKIMKKIDIFYFNKEVKLFDCYTILTKHMADVLNIKSREYIIVEGIFDKIINNVSNNTVNNIFTIAYVGKLNIRFGVNDLVKTFTEIKGENLELILCGNGDSVPFILNCALIDKRIHYLGQVSAEQSKSIISNSNLLINPRKNNEEYTKYSFPSKNIEYLSTGKPVIAYKLDGIPDDYDNFFFYVNEEEKNGLKNCIESIIKMDENERNKKSINGIQYLMKNRLDKTVAKNIIDLLQKTNSINRRDKE